MRCHYNRVRVKAAYARAGDRLREPGQRGGPVRVGAPGHARAAGGGDPACRSRPMPRRRAAATTQRRPALPLLLRPRRGRPGPAGARHAAWLGACGVHGGAKGSTAARVDAVLAPRPCWGPAAARDAAAGWAAGGEAAAQACAMAALPGYTSA